MSFKKEHRQETIIYLALWGLIFMAPVMSLAIRTSNSDIDFNWSEILTVWREYVPFFIVFLIHNHLMAPMLVYKQQKVAYIVLCLAIVVIFQVYQNNHRPDFRQKREFRREMMMREGRQKDSAVFRGPRELGELEKHREPGKHEEFGEPGKHGEFGGPREFDDFREPGEPGGPTPKERFHDRKRDDKHPPIFFGQHDIIAIIILILMLGMNLGIKLYFRQRGDQKKLAELEKENLEQQLEYLKYQINPHFFMNTLNNIHALVDIDPEKAKQTILELSKMMRFVLYEGNKKGVPLDREIAFLQNYITLMKLRYTDKVKITVETPASLPNKEVPPLMFITFVENAFKHGVSYRQESFINIKTEVEDNQLIFTCSNSRIPKEDDKHGGVGLANVKQRLQLIYGDRYNLDIKDEPNVYTVKLKIPI